MTTKLLKGALTRFAVMAIAAVFFTPLASAAMASGEMENPVTGETETYVNTFTGGADGTATEWNSADNWDTSVKPFIADGNFDASLVNGKTATTTTQLEGWTPRIGAYNGAVVTFSGGINKVQADSVGAWLTADDTSSITIASFGGAQLEGSSTYPFKLSSAKAGGITWSAGLTAASNTTLPFWYYLKGAGTVVYGGDITVANAQVIKQADVTLSGTSQVASKTLVSFGSGTTKTFTADAAIKVYGTDGTTLEGTVNLATVNTTGTITLTTDDTVGSCELVQTSTGIVLYYVDGANFVAKTYTPSISVNFCDGNNPLTTAADVGLGAYAVPGTSWNNMVSAGGNNGTFTTPLSTIYGIDSTGAQTLIPNASATISGTRGSWGCSSLVAGSDVRHGYADDNSTYPTPTATISGIPYYQYRVIVYTATDAANTAFGYITVNGTDYTYENSALAEGTAAWGASGAANTAEALAEGVNVLVSPVTSGSTATVVGHNSNGRGCIAAVQIVEVPKTAGEGELVINVSGDTTYAVDADATYTTVYVTGVGTLSFSGEGAITTTTLNIGNGVTMPMDATHLSPTTVTGSGTIVYDDAQPATTLGFDDSANWQGTVWVKNVGDTTKGEAANAKVSTCLGSNTTDATSNDLNKWGNAASFVKFTNVRGYMATANVPWTLILEDDSSNYAWYNNEGWTARTITIAGLKGNGTFWDVNDGGTRPFLNFADASQFTGAIHATGKQVFLSGAGTGNASDLSAGRITIPANQTLTVASGKTWHTRNGLVVDGTLNVNGTLASDSTTAAVSGSGMVVFTGRLPTPVDGSNETKWWKNANWTGTVQIDSLSGFIGTGTGTVLAPNDYGNTGSTLELKNCSGWLPVNYECTVPLSVAGTLTIGNGYSGISNAFTIDHLKGNGQITCNGSAPTVLIYVREWSGYTGKIKMDNKMIVFGDDTVTTSDLVSGTIYICEGAVVTNLSNSHWELSGSMKVNGTFAVTARSGWSDGKGAVLGENGIINFIGSGVDDHAYNFSNITGSGKILFTNGTGYSMLPSDASRMPSTDVAVVNDNTESFVVLTCTDTTTIGTLSGSGKFDSRYGNATTRRLAVVQSADSEWSGIFVNNDRVGGMDVSAKSGATAKTLTLSGTQTANNELVVQAATENTDAGSVNLTGTWVGDTTVSGTFGGTGTLTGNLTLTDGATIKVNDISDPLTVSGSLTATGAITIELPEGAGKGMIFTTGSKPDISGATFTTKIGGVEKKLKVTATADGLKVGVQSLLIRIM